MKNKYTLLLIVILLVGSFLRLYKIDYQSLWLDELVTMTQVDLPTIADVINITKNADAHPPGFYIILHYWIKVFGNTEVQLRMISAIAGILSILLIFVLAKKIYSNSEGLISAALLSISWFPIYYSQEARAYSLLLFCSILSTIFFLDILQKFFFDKNLKKNSIFIYIISTILTSFIHYFGLYLIALHGLLLLVISVIRKKYFKEFIIIYLPSFILYLLWLPAMLLQFNGQAGQHFDAPTLGNIIDCFIYFFNYNKLVSFVYLLIISILTLYILYERKWDFKRLLNNLSFGSRFVFAWAIIPLFLIFIVSQFKPVFTYRNMSIIYPAVLIIFSRIISLSIKKEFLKILLVSGFLIFLSFNLIITKGYYKEPTKEQFRQSSQYLIENNKYKNSEILAYGYNPDFFNFYFKKFNSDLRVDKFIHFNYSNEQAQNVIKECNSNYLWFIYGHDEPKDVFLKFIRNKYSLVKFQEYIGCGIYLFQKKKNDI